MANDASVDLAHSFAERLGVTLELIVFDNAGKAMSAVTQEQADIGFLATRLKRGNSSKVAVRCEKAPAPHS